MSRSSWAWARSCGLVGAAVLGVGRLGKLEVRESLEAGPPVRMPSSLAALTWVATAVMLTLAFTPALASGKSASRSGRAPAGRALPSAIGKPVTRTERSSGPPHFSGSGRQPARAQVLAFGSGYTDAHVAQAVRALQRRLADLGYTPGPIDGRYGPFTEGAVIRFQATNGLVPDGLAGPRTMAALASAKLVLRPGDGYVAGGSAPVKALQRHLAAAGFPPGPIDGRFGPLTERAVTRFQTARRLHVDGIAGPQTLGRLRRATQRTAGPRPRPRPAPHPTRPRAPSPPTPTTSTPAPQTAHHTRHSGGSPLLPWLVVAAVLMLAVLSGLLWHRHKGRSGRAQAGAADPAGTSMAPPDATADATATGVHDRARDHLPQPLRPPDGSPAFKLARLLAEAGNVAGAADAFRRADERGHPTAAFELGALLLDAGDLAGAEDAFRRADERGHAVAAWNLGSLLEQQGDHEGARAAYERAERRGEPGAALDLGVLLANAGDLAGAEAAFARGDQRGDPDAACNLGLLLEQRGDLTGAKAAYGRAYGRGHSVGAWNLGSLLEREGDRAGARAAYERASEAGPPELAELAYAALRELRSEESDEP